MRGSNADVIVPKLLEVSREFGSLKFTLLNRLKNSPLNCKLVRSLILKSFLTPKGHTRSAPSWDRRWDRPVAWDRRCRRMVAAADEFLLLIPRRRRELLPSGAGYGR